MDLGALEGRLGKLSRLQEEADEKVSKLEGRMEQGLRDLANAYVREASGRAKRLYEDLFFLVLQMTFTGANAETSAAFTVATDFHFDLIKLSTSPLSFANRWAFKLTDGSSDVLLQNNWLPAETLLGSGQLPYVTVAPRRFKAQGNVTILGRDLNLGGFNYPYTVYTVLHGRKVFIGRHIVEE
jgi:hypothetical protein